MAHKKRSVPAACPESAARRRFETAGGFATILSFNLALALLASCASSTGTPDGSGGRRGSGGQAGGATGGQNGSGGASATGGTSGSGGFIGSGGSGTGGSGTGGRDTTTGTGGSATGGTGFGGSGSGGTGSGSGGRGVGGASGTGGNGGGTGVPCSTGPSVLCDDFEKYATGSRPSGTPWLLAECSGTNFVLRVDEAQKRSGLKSLASQGLPYTGCMLRADIGSLTDFWVRANVFFAKGGTNQFSAHEVTAFELTSQPNMDDPSIRVGFRGDNSCDPTGVEVNITGGEEQTGCTGFKLETDKWYCLELHVVTDASSTTADLFIDGANQSYKNHGRPVETVVDPNARAWRYLRLGSRSYGGQYPALIHVDDIAVATSRIGCN